MALLVELSCQGILGTEIGVRFVRSAITKAEGIAGYLNVFVISDRAKMV